MPIIDDITHLLSGMKNTVQSAMLPEGLAQDRFTHTPIFTQTPDDPGASAQWHGYVTPLGMALHHPIDYLQAKIAGMPTQSMIQIQPPELALSKGELPGDPEDRNHEVMHAITMPHLLDRQGDVYQNISQLIPNNIKQQIDQKWGAIPGHDVVREGVPYILTGYSFQDPKYNKLKKSIIDSFPAPTKAKIIRAVSTARNVPVTDIDATRPWADAAEKNYGPYGPGSKE